MALLHNVFTSFYWTCKILLAVHLKHSSFWPPADVTPLPNDLVHVTFGQCMFALSQCVYYYICGNHNWTKTFRVEVASVCGWDKA